MDAIQLCGNGEIIVYDDTTEWANSEKCAELVSGALEGPLGFTWDDVTILREMPAYVQGMGLGPDPNGVAAFIMGLADRIASLLPPQA